MPRLDDFPLPATARHDEHGNHVPPRLPHWRRTAGTDATIRGRDVEADQRRKAQFAAHLAEHRRRGEPDTVIEEI